jgi:hypothetical protein
MLAQPAPAQKSIKAVISNPLSHVSILQQVLSYVGPGHWWYVATVCSLWRDLYKELSTVQLVGYRGLYNHNVSITCTPQMTLYSAVFASASRFRSAQKMLDCKAEEYWSAAVQVDTLTPTLSKQHMSVTCLTLWQQCWADSVRSATSLQRCSSCTQRVVPGTSQSAQQLLRTVVLRCCVGRSSTAAIGKSRRFYNQQQAAAT